MNSEQKTNLELSKKAYKAIEALLPEAQRDDIREYIFDVNEWGLGVEAIIDTLLDEEIAVNKEQYEIIKSAADAMNLDRGQDELIICQDYK